jgi:hypothetical protein
MHDKPAIAPAAFIILSMLLILAGFALAIGYTGKPGLFLILLPISGGLPGSVPVPFYLLAFANPALWTALLVLGWRRYGRRALWLLLVAPFAFYLVPIVLLLLSLGR